MNWVCFIWQLALELLLYLLINPRDKELCFKWQRSDGMSQVSQGMLWNYLRCYIWFIDCFKPRVTISAASNKHCLRDTSNTSQRFSGVFRPDCLLWDPLGTRAHPLPPLMRCGDANQALRTPAKREHEKPRHREQERKVPLWVIYPKWTLQTPKMKLFSLQNTCKVCVLEFCTQFLWPIAVDVFKNSLTGTQGRCSLQYACCISIKRELGKDPSSKETNKQINK